MLYRKKVLFKDCSEVGCGGSGDELARIPGFWKLRQEDFELHTSLACITKPSPEKTNGEKKKEKTYGGDENNGKY